MVIKLRSKRRIAIPAAVIQEAGFKVGDELVLRVEVGRIVLSSKRQDLLDWVAGFGGIYDGYDFAAERADAW